MKNLFKSALGIVNHENFIYLATRNETGPSKPDNQSIPLELSEKSKNWVGPQLSNFKENITDGINIEECISLLSPFKNAQFSERNNTPTNSAQAIIGIQAGLKHLGYDPGAIDGVYSNKNKETDRSLSNTAKAIKAFQKIAFPNEKKEWDGIPGPKTIGKLLARLNEKQSEITTRNTLEKNTKAQQTFTTKVFEYYNQLTTESAKERYLKASNLLIKDGITSDNLGTKVELLIDTFKPIKEKEEEARLEKKKHTPFLPDELVKIQSDMAGEYTKKINILPEENQKNKLFDTLYKVLPTITNKATLDAAKATLDTQLQE